MLIRSSSAPFIALVGFTVVCSYREDEDLKELWHDLSSKNANFWNQQDTNSCIFPTDKNFWTPRDLVTTVVVLGCRKSRGTSTRGNCSGFCNLSDNIFLFHLGKVCRPGKKMTS